MKQTALLKRKFEARKWKRRTGGLYWSHLEQRAGRQLVIFPVRGPHFRQAGSTKTKLCHKKKMTYINSWSEPKQTTLFPKCPNVSQMQNAVWIIKNTSAYKTSGNVSVDYFQADSDKGVALSFKPTLNTINQQSELLIMTGHLITTVKDCVLMLYLVSAHNCLQSLTVMSQVWNVSNNLWFQSKLQSTQNQENNSRRFKKKLVLFTLHFGKVTVKRMPNELFLFAVCPWPHSQLSLDHLRYWRKT